ncbi:sulfotransferase family 2 domain-containing protein [Roseovarius salis]|uniref:sulfotransferase family 2 domain-containing protein n=1 Tax=Roseovarius salis TaxID=3376063 RepID=UPI0037CC285D
MIVNHTYRFIFIHTPKAAGTSVSRMLSEFTHYRDQEIGGTRRGEAAARYFHNRFGLGKHSTAIQIRKIMGDDTWQSYFTFGFVRNPYTRLVSTFQFLKGWNGCPADVRKRIEAFDDVQGFLESDYWSDNPGPDNIFRPQTFWLCGPAPDRPLLVNHVGHVETLADDIAEIRNRIGLKPTDTPPPFANRSARLPGEILWTDDLVERVQHRYRTDFAVFGYGMSPPMPEATC